MKVIIAGGRNFFNYEFLKMKCDVILHGKPIVEIVSGTANGADRLGERYAKEKGYTITQFPAQWDKFGKSAGYKRNQQMAEYADSLIVFWDGKSRGSKHMIDIAKSQGLTISVFQY